MEINHLNIKIWSKLGQRGAVFGHAIFEVAENHENVMVLSADLAYLSGLERFIKKYPTKFINTGIAEQNMLGISAGLAQEGKIVFCTTYATFVTMRSCEQMRHYMGYMKSNIKVIGSGAGLIMTFSGNTHYTIEDIAIIRAIPNIVVISPADALEAIKAVYASAEYQGPVYIRLTGGLNNPIVYKEDYKFKIGSAIELKSEGDFTLFATGSMVSNALKAAEILKCKDIQLRVVNIHTIKPIDIESIVYHNSISKLLISVEEHGIIGGLGGAISEVISNLSNAKPLLRIGIADSFFHSGDYHYLLEINSLLPEQIAANIEQRISDLENEFN